MKNNSEQSGNSGEVKARLAEELSSPDFEVKTTRKELVKFREESRESMKKEIIDKLEELTRIQFVNGGEMYITVKSLEKVINEINKL